MLQFCTSFLTGRVQNPSNCAQYYDCTKNLTAVQECRYPDLYHVPSQECRHYSEVECKGRHVFLDPCQYLSDRNVHAVLLVKLSSPLASLVLPPPPHHALKHVGTCS